jgi:hypothetical protein
MLAIDLHVGPARVALRADQLAAEVVVVSPLPDDAALVLADHRLHRLEELQVDDGLVVALVFLAVPAHDALVELVREKAMHLRDGGDRAERGAKPWSALRSRSCRIERWPAPKTSNASRTSGAWTGS